MGLFGPLSWLPNHLDLVGQPVGEPVRQLIALTAALASDRKLLLLDEALSNIDPIFAAGLRRLIESLPATVVEARHVIA